MKVTQPHFRIQFPKDYRGFKHRAKDGRVFVKFAELEEIELPNVLAVQVGDGRGDGAWEIEITFVASAEVEYTGEKP